MSLYLTGFGDEISTDLDTQLATLRRLRVPALDLRTAFGKNVLQLSDGEIDAVKQSCDDARIRIQSVSSPVNKVKFSGAAQSEELKKLERATEIAKRVGIRRIRIFSPETDATGGAEAWPDVRIWMAEQVELARSSDVLLMHENDGRFFGAFPDNARRLLEEFSGPHFRAIYDFGNAVLIGTRTMRDWFPWIVPFLDTLHVKDAIEADGKFVEAGAGDGEVLQALTYLHENGWEGPLTLEPHAQIAGAQGGFSGEDAFGYAVLALRRVMFQAGMLT
jgi:sugar phosphate isomerase/epimerase